MSDPQHDPRFDSAAGPTPSQFDSSPFGARRLNQPSDQASTGPQSFGPFRLQRELGRGAYGVVYLARRTGSSQPVALKILLGEGDEEGEARFQLEAQVAGKLDHPGIVPVLDAGTIGRHRYAALEFCPGQTLKQRLLGGPLPHAEATQVVAKLARAANHAHRHGVLHRDLKPANVLLDTNSWQPRITDFGLARDRSLRRSLTRTGDVLGTPAYMAPEQILGERSVDRRADVYALGVTLYQCLTGEVPYSATTIPELVQVVLQGRARPPHELEPSVPLELSRVCLRAMASQADARFPTAEAFALALEGTLGSQPPQATNPRPPRPSWLGPVIGLVVGLLVALLVVVFSVGQAPSTPPTPTSPPEASTPRPRETPAAPPTPKLAPEAELEAMGSTLLDSYRLLKQYGVQDPWATERPRLLRLQEAFPDDPRLAVFEAYRALIEKRGTVLDVCREARKLDDTDPPLPPTFATILARLFVAIGFMRAGRDCVESAANPDFEHPWVGLTLMHIRAVTYPPVQDVEAACAAAPLTVACLERTNSLADDRSHPPGFDVYANLAIYRLHLGQREAALTAAARAASLPQAEAQLRNMQGLRGAIRSGRIQREQALDAISALFGLDPLSAVLQANQAPPRAQPKAEALRLQRMIPRAPTPTEAALLAVGAARAFTRAGERDLAESLLEAALARGLTQAPDVQALLQRALARSLLAAPAQAQRAVELARLATAQPALTRGERADAWLLTARAHWQLGDSEAAKRAKRNAEALEPFDTRELQALPF